MDYFRNLIKGGEDRIIAELVRHVRCRGYAKYTSTLEEAWRISVRGLSSALVKAAEAGLEALEMSPEDDFASDPVAAFGVLEAERHRERGINLSMFLGLLKYYRQAYIDVVDEAGFDPDDRGHYHLLVERFFDRVEIAVASAWAGDSSDQRIEELRSTQRVLTNEKNKYLTIFESSSIPTFLLNPNHCVDDCNRAAALLMGRAGVPGASYYCGLRDRLFEAGVDESNGIDSTCIQAERIDSALPWIAEEFQDFAAGQDPERVFEKSVATDGETKWFEVRFSRMLDISGKFAGIIVALTDITDRWSAQDALVSERERLAVTLRSIGDGVFVTDTNARIVMMNETSEQLTGRREAEALGRPLDEVFHIISEQTRERCRNPVELVLKSGRIVGLANDTLLVTRSGEELTIADSAAPVRNADGEIIGVVLVFRDVTEAKRREAALKESVKKHRNIIENIEEGYYELDPNGDLVFFNDSLCRILGYPSDELNGMNYRRFMEPETAAEIRSALQAAAESGDSATMYSRRGLRKDGSTAFIDISVSPLRDESGNIRGFGGICRDVTERKRTEEILRRSERLEAVANLSAGVSHNFNNVLQIVLGNAQLGLANLADGLPAEVKANLDQILSTSNYAAQTVKRLNEFAGAIGSEPVTTVFDLSETVLKAVETSQVWWKAIPERRGLSVNMMTDCRPGCVVHGRENELFEVAVNLIKNAAEALTVGGEISVSTHMDGDRVVLTVSDTGAGISIEDLNRIFDPFFTTKGVAGMGMGLSSAHGIVTSHKGRISVDATEGAGTVFTVTLPQAGKSEEISAEVAPDDAPRKLQVLVVDDMELVGRMIAEGLDRSGLEARAARSGEEALELFRERPADVVICDLSMPGMNGWAVCREINAMCRSRGAPGPGLVILTGWSEHPFEQDVIDSAGVHRIVRKPVDVPMLMSVIREVQEMRCGNPAS